MICVVVAGHGNLASDIVRTAERTLGKQEYLKAISVKFGEGEEGLRNKLGAVLSMAAVDDVIVLSDIFGSSFSRGCVGLAKDKGHVAVVTGVNLPMVLKVLTYRERANLVELVALACKSGQEGIRDACGLLDEKRETEQK